MNQARASPASSPPATVPSTPTRFIAAAPVLCCAGADEDAEVASKFTVLLAVLDTLEDANDEEERLEDCDAAAVDCENVDGRTIPEMVVAMLKAFVGWMAGRSVCVGMTSPVCAK